MNEIREVAMAYYERATSEKQELANQFFQLLDINGDGKVSLAEYKSVVVLLEPRLSNDQLFNQLDEKSDGFLDFGEVLALFYMHAVQIPRCNGCYNLLTGSYFSCLLCEKDFPDNSYDLCCNCYARGRIQHHHPLDTFMDNRSKRSLLAQFMNRAQVTLPGHPDQEMRNAAALHPSISRAKSKREKAKEVVLTLANTVSVVTAGNTVGNWAVSSGCTIL